MTSISAQHTMKTSVTYSSMGQTSSSRCCSTGRPIMADPLTGSTICSCQLQSGIPAYMSRVPTLPETVYGSAGGLGFPTVSGADHSSAFLPMFQPERVPDHLKSAPGVIKHPYYMPEHLYSGHPYATMNFGFDINGARRKNATRETTSALKAWLHQHQKNPYPTKAEKIMLAVITQMSLTQVSTWFANARRRLKKENKLDGKQIDLDDIDIDDSTPHNRSVSSRLSESDSEGSANSTKTSVELSDVSDVEDATFPNKPAKKCVQRLFSPDGRSEVFLERLASPASENCAPDSDINKRADERKQDLVSNPQISRDISTSGKLQMNNGSASAGQPKQKIWSISEIIS